MMFGGAGVGAGVGGVCLLHGLAAVDREPGLIGFHFSFQACVCAA